MDIAELRSFCLSLGEVEEKTPFGKFAAKYDSILVFYVCGHMFCFVDMDNFTSVTVKSTPDEIDRLYLSHNSVGKPTNMSPKHWIQLNLNGDIHDKAIYDLIRSSYSIVKTRYTPKKKATPDHR